MDAARSTRKFPSYSTKELKGFVAKAGDAANPVMVQEIADREAGVSVPVFAPQIKAGNIVINRIGRM
jgi:hypothetical protein